MSRTINKVTIKRIENLEDVKKTLEIFLSCLIIERDYIDQIPVFLNVF